MSEKSINYMVYALKGGFLILPVLALIVSSFLFFPFISGKNFFFRIVVEVLFFVWVFVACFDKKYRPKKSPILFALAATLFFLAISTAFGANPYRSFWSNYERMEGLIGHIHLFAYFLILSNVFKKEKDWKWFFFSVIGIGLITTIYGFLQFFGVLEIHQGDIRLDATFGNATYLAIFLIFNLFLVALAFLKSNNKLLRISLAVLFAAELIIVFLTATRGAIIGFIIGAIIFGLLTVFLGNNKKVRNITLGFLILVALIVSLFFVFKNSNFVKTNYVLSRFAYISFSERTVESRFTIWKMSFQGFLERPVFGWGPDNYNIVFNKYYRPELWQQEVWFDRAHNIVFDWLISSGIFGFLAYWSIWVAAIFIVINSYRKKYFTSSELGLFLGLFAAYAFHNIFVFDNLTSYFMFFSVLGYLHFRYEKTNQENNNLKEEEKTIIKNISISQYVIITVAFILVFFSLYFASMKPFLACRQLLTSLSEIRTRGTEVDFMIKEFDKIFAYKTFGNIEAREQLGAYAENLFSVQIISAQDKTKVMSKAIKEMENQTEVLPDDARAYLFLSTLYTKSGSPDNALKAALRALELSPKKQQIYFSMADIYFSANQQEKAFNVLERAYDLDKNYPEALKNLIIAAIASKKQDLAEKYLAEAKSRGMNFIKGRETQFISAYAKAGNFVKIKELWLEVIAREPNNPQYHFSLAATYMQLGEKNNAIKEIQKVIELSPGFKQQGEYYINEIRAGRNP